MRWQGPSGSRTRTIPTPTDHAPPPPGSGTGTGESLGLVCESAPRCADQLFDIPERRLARKPNYDYEKRKKEADRKAKKDAKREERQRRRALGLPDEDIEGDSSDADGAADGTPDDAEREA